MDYQVIKEEDIIIAYMAMEEKHQHRYEHDKAHELLGQVLKDFYGEDMSTLNMQKEAHGKPHFVDSDICFNISHCRGMAACALSKQWKLGIDVENVRPFKENVAKRVMSDRELKELSKASEPELCFFRAWTYKESVVKLSGNGIREDLTQIDSVENAFAVSRYEITVDGKTYIISLAKEKNTVK